MYDLESYLNNGVMYKRQGKYLEALGCYRKADLLIEECSCTKDYVYRLFKAYGKLTFILGKYETSCLCYRSCIEVLISIGNGMGGRIENAKELMNIDINIPMHLGYSICACRGELDELTYDTYRRSIDPYFDQTHNKAKKSNLNINNDSKYIAAAVMYIDNIKPSVFE